MTSWWFLDTHVIEHRSGAPAVLEMTLPPGAAPPAHLHHGYDDSFFVLDGELVLRRGPEVLFPRPGDWVAVPAGTAHAFRVTGRRPARLLVVVATTSFVELVHQLGEPARRDALPPPGRSPSAEEVYRSFAAHDVDVVGDSISEKEARELRCRRASRR